MRSPDPQIPGDETLFRTVNPDHCTGDRVMYFDKREEMGTSVIRSSYVRSVDECFDRVRRPSESALAHTTPDRVPREVDAPPGEPWELRVCDDPTPESIAHAEIRPYRPKATKFTRPSKDGEKAAIRAAIVTAFRVLRAGDQISAFGTRLD